MLAFLLSAILSSSALFLCEPMLAKRLLPMLGGVPAVWNTCMLFYQCLLLAGYAYAHLLTRHFPLPKQLRIHLAVIVAATASLAVGTPNWSQPSAEAAPFWLLAYLFVSIGLPFFVLSTNAPLVQRWFSLTQSGREPYFLYAASNVGSLTALLSYPLLIEPTLTLIQQQFLFIAVFVGFAAMSVGIIFDLLDKAPALACETGATRNHAAAASEIAAAGNQVAAVCEIPPTPEPVSDAQSAAVTGLNAKRTPSTKVQRLRWIALAFVPSSLLLSVTQFITTNLSPIPLFWVIPLALYLLTFIIAFAPGSLIKQKFALTLEALLLVALAVLLTWDQIERNYAILFPLHLGTLFFVSLVCHQELYAERPSAARLTEFYFCVALGGALGGMFNALVAPMVFSTLIEYPIGIALACLLRPRTSLFGKHFNWPVNVAIFAVAIAVLFGLYLNKESLPFPNTHILLAVLIPPAILCLLLCNRPLLMSACLAAMLFVGATFWRTELLFHGRNFFGTLKVQKYDTIHYLVHGAIMHGAENFNKGRPSLPTTYYYRGSPVGEILTTLEPQLVNANVASVGLGAGTLAWYAKPGQHWTFYDINPMVDKIARDANLFTFLTDCKAANETVIGDGRLSIAQAPDHTFKVMMFDAFTSDAIPMHLLTKEAIELYLSKLTPDGYLIFNVSGVIDLKSTLREEAKAAHLACLVKDGPADPDDAVLNGPSTWLVMARQPQLLEPFRQLGFTEPDQTRPASLWTDDFSNLLQTLR